MNLTHATGGFMDRWLEFECPNQGMDFDLEMLPYGTRHTCSCCGMEWTLTEKNCNAYEEGGDQIRSIENEWKRERWDQLCVEAPQNPIVQVGESAEKAGREFDLDSFLAAALMLEEEVTVMGTTEKAFRSLQEAWDPLADHLAGCFVAIFKDWRFWSLYAVVAILAVLLLQ